MIGLFANRNAAASAEAGMTKICIVFIGLLVNVRTVRTCSTEEFGSHERNFLKRSLNVGLFEIKHLEPGFTFILHGLSQRWTSLIGSLVKQPLHVLSS